MAKYTVKNKEEVRKLRKSGFSINDIQIKTDLPKTTIYDWIRDIELTSEQKDLFKRRVQQSLQKGRIEAQRIFREERSNLEQKMLSVGKKDIGVLSDRDLFIAGVALYWAEGFKNKHERRLGFCNSDPSMIRFYLQWLQKMGIKEDQIIARLTLNISYKEETERIISFWSKLTNIPKSQFTKTFYQQSLWKKEFQNNEYYGVLRIHVKGSIEYLLKMRGWIDGLRTN